jgi:cephalosporin hydroxylase
MEIKHRSELYKLLPPLPAVAEVGVAEGLFSREILSWGLSKLWLVDIWESHPEFPGDAGSPQEWHNKNFQTVTRALIDFSNVEFLRGPSVAMAQFVPRETLDFVYIDACHSYECVKADIKAWAPKLKPGGIIAFHDYLAMEYGVNRAVHEFALQHGVTVNTIAENKPCDASAWIRL